MSELKINYPIKLMDKASRKAFRQKIESALATAIEDIARLKELTKPIPPNDAIGRLTRMEAIGEKSINEANLRSATLRQSQLASALNKIDDPKFGICAGCGEVIPAARMMAMPETIYCVSCAD